MARISLAAYSLRIKDSDGEYYTLGKFAGTDDSHEVFLGYLKELKKNFSHDQEAKRLLKVVQLTRGNRILNGVVETGEYGFESNLYDLGKRAISHKRTTQEAEMLPFYFLLYLPSDSNRGIVLLQRFKQFGIRKIFLGTLRDMFRNTYPGLRIQMEPIIPKKMLDKFLREGRLTKVRFINHKIPKDIADEYDSRPSQDESGHIELVLVAKRDGYLPLHRKIREFTSGKTKVTNFIELEDFEYDDVKLEIELNKARRTVDLSQLGKIRAYIDVSESVKILANGHPSYPSIDAAARSLLEDLLGSAE